MTSDRNWSFHDVWLVRNEWLSESNIKSQTLILRFTKKPSKSTRSNKNWEIFEYFERYVQENTIIQLNHSNMVYWEEITSNLKLSWCLNDQTEWLSESNITSQTLILIFTEKPSKSTRSSNNWVKNFWIFWKISSRKISKTDLHTWKEEVADMSQLFFSALLFSSLLFSRLWRDETKDWYFLFFCFWMFKISLFWVIGPSPKHSAH